MNKNLNVIGYEPNWDNIRRLVDDGFIRESCHPADPSLLIHNYTQKTQFENYWTEETLLCRGLISRDRQIIARPFQKFFNYSELPEPPKGPWRRHEKMDGSLGILYEFGPGDWRIATRGAFESDQAVWATRWLNHNAPEFVPMPNRTYLFEIIYPENRIVVDYGSMEGLVFLDCLETDTGKKTELPMYLPFPMAEDHGEHDEIPLKEDRPNCEGYVLVNADQFRVKVKHEEYVRLHRIITNCSSRTVWEYLKDDLEFDELLVNVPDEFYRWLNETRDNLIIEYRHIEEKARCHFTLRPMTEDRKKLAQYFQKHDHPWLCFAMLDDKDYSEKIWKMIKPDRELPFIAGLDEAA